MRAGLTFPVGRCGSMLRKGGYSNRTGRGAAVAMAAVMEYLVAEILDLAGEVCKDHKKKQLRPRHIELSVRNDGDFGRLF